VWPRPCSSEVHERRSYLFRFVLIGQEKQVTDLFGGGANEHDFGAVRQQSLTAFAHFLAVHKRAIGTNVTTGAQRATSSNGNQRLQRVELVHYLKSLQKITCFSSRLILQC
jgi:hypothetical protein